MASILQIMIWKFPNSTLIQSYNDQLIDIQPGPFPSTQEIAQITAEYNEFLRITQNNAIIDSQLQANDLRMIRSLSENDTVRIAQFKAAQAELRLRKIPPAP